MSHVIAAILALAQPVGEPVASPAAGPTFTLIDGAGNARPARLVSVEGRVVTFLDALGRRRSEADALALIAEERLPPASRPEASAYVELVDGQRLAGELGPAGDGESILWRMEGGTELTIPLERLWSVVLRPGFAPSPSPSGDSVLLVNGDVLQGFVASVGATVRVENAGRAVEAPVERVASIAFLNARSRAQGTLLWLAGGAVVAVSGLEVRAGAVSAELLLGRESGGAPATISASVQEMTAVVLAAERVRALGAIAPAAQRPVGDRRWMPALEVEPAERGPAPAVLMPGPMSVEWPLPEGAGRFVALVSLPRDCRDWGDLDAIVEAGPAQGPWVVLAREHLHGERPWAEVNAALPPGATVLRVRIDERDSGPIQDRLHLERALILVGP